MHNENDRTVPNFADAFSQFAQNLAFIGGQGFSQISGSFPVETGEKLVAIPFLFFSSFQRLALLAQRCFGCLQICAPKIKNPPARSLSGGGSLGYSIRVGRLDW